MDREPRDLESDAPHSSKGAGGAQSRFRYRRYHHIRCRSDFLSIGALPRRRGRYVIIHQRRNGRAYSRLGIVATKKIGDAVERNRAKRLVREVFRRLQSQIDPRRDLVVRVLPSMKRVTLKDLRKDIENVLSHSPPKPV